MVFAFRGLDNIRSEFSQRAKLSFLVGIKNMFLHFCVLWIRATFPRYRYDQIMRLGWKIFIPVTIVWIAVEGLMAWMKVGPWAI